MSAFTPVARAIQFIKDNKARMFWLWIAYQAIKGTITLTLIWIPLFLLWKRGAGADVSLKDWAPYIAAMILFPLSHVLMAIKPVSSRLKAVLGDSGFRIAFSVVSLVMLGWLVWEAVRAPVVPLWASEPWQHGFALMLIMIGIILFVFGVGVANPFSVFGSGAAYQAEEPGILRLTRHPALFGLAFWGAGHTLANGSFALMLFFLVQTAFALLGAVSMDRRHKKAMGEQTWSLMTEKTSFWPNPLTIMRRVDNPVRVSVRWLLSLVLIAGLIALHPVLFGVYPLALATSG